MDIGHGGGSFSFKTAQAMIDAGYRPDVISSDIHQASINGPMFDLPTCLSKFLALGMSLPDVIYTATARPAAVMGMQNEVGTLKPGALADVALFKMAEGDFTFYDVFMNPYKGTQLLHNTLTLLNGRELQRVPAEPPAPWIELSQAQQSLIQNRQRPSDYCC
ncbi:MAG: amidohydrolase family protein, partial [Caldilineaceae bacterium]|nr:amidohydrolase family protein [Caldilineaceae bacterium]MCB0140346.1 amidohydrolase family protein [Caldilineaceae bacterium]